MAEGEEPLGDITLLKRTRISVFVDEALPDILVVTYEFGVKIFKGVLLDSTKKNLPCGIQTLHPAFGSSATKAGKTNPDDDTLYAVNQRFAYTDSTYARKHAQGPAKHSKNRMTVRLRPRQVLCSKCKGICNENSENVSRKRKTTEPPPSISAPVKRGLNAPMTRSVYSELRLNNNNNNTSNNNSSSNTNSSSNLNTQGRRKHRLQEATLIPKLTRLTPEEESRALGGHLQKTNLDSSEIQGGQKRPLANTNSLNADSSLGQHNQSDENSGVLDGSHVSTRTTRRFLRKKRSVGSMEDLWDETVFEENINRSQQNQQNTTEQQTPSNNCVPSTRTIKISYGPQGEGTVLKIPAQIEATDVSALASDSDEPTGPATDPLAIPDPPAPITSISDERAARKALKKAKKEARRKFLMSSVGTAASPRCFPSPRYIPSPRYAPSPRYTIGSASPRQGLGGASPRYIYAANGFEVGVPRRRKHKMKHKKKHKEDKDRRHSKDGETASIQEESKPPCFVAQKLSINLKRLNNTYTSTARQISDKLKEKQEDAQSSSDEVPDFPPSNPPLMLRINPQTVSSALGADGDRLLVGDVVWGKIHGFPWWPGKVLTITDDPGGPQAHVAWYGSSTSSLMQCDQLSPYLENFKIRYNKKKRGPYKEAVRQATNDARENAENRNRQSSAGSPSRNNGNIISQIRPPTLASPREIDVIS